MADRKRILQEALTLPPLERAEVIDTLLASLDEPDSTIDTLWVEEAESRLAAYDRGELKSILLAEILAKYGKS